MKNVIFAAFAALMLAGCGIENWNMRGGDGGAALRNFGKDNQASSTQNCTITETMPGSYTRTCY